MSDEVEVKDDYWWQKRKKSEILVVYLTYKKEFGVSMESPDGGVELTINNKDAKALLDAGLTFTPEAEQHVQ